MLLKVTKISEVTSNGNRILTLNGVGEKVQTPFGVKTPKYSFCMAVEDGTEPEVGFEADIDISQYIQVERPFVTDENITVTTKWLSVK